MANLTDFKIYFTDCYTNDDSVRRIQFDVSNVSKNIFFAHIRDLCELTENSTLNIRYEDWNNNGKLHNILTDDEWTHLIKIIDEAESSIVVRLQVMTGAVHKGIICDVCDNLLMGDRFHCLECCDYDLCQKCFIAAPKTHKDHPMILLRNSEHSKKYMHGGGTVRVVDINLGQLGFAEPATAPQEPQENQSTALSKDYFDNLPQFIKDGYKTLKSMGFTDTRILVRLLVENNGDIPNVVDQLERMDPLKK